MDIKPLGKLENEGQDELFNALVHSKMTLEQF